MKGRQPPITTPRITRMSRMFFLCSHGSVSRDFGTASVSIERAGNSGIRRERGFSLIVALIMVALMAVIAVGVFAAVSLERVTATSYSSRYQADLAAQNALQAAAKTLLATPDGTNPITGKDTFLVVRADGPAENGITPSYYYLAQPAPNPGSSITYYPLFSSSTDPNTPDIQTGTIVLDAFDPRAAHAPFVPPPAAPANSNSTDQGAAWNASGTQRLPGLYSWQQPAAPSGPTVQWVEMRDPQDTAPAPAHNLPYTRYAYWVEDMDGYLDASQVNDPTYLNARPGLSPTPPAYTVGTSSKEIAMFTIFNPTQQTVDPNPTSVTNLVNYRPLLLTVPTVQQVAGTNPDVAGPNLAVRLGVDNNPGEQNLVPLGYGYSRNDTSHVGEGYPKMPINPISQFRPQGNQIGQFATIVSTAMPNFQDRTLAAQPGVHGHSGQTRNYFNNLTANLFNYAYPLDAPAEFGPPGNPDGPPSYRGIGAYPFVTSLYDLNNWVQTVQIGTTYNVVIETK